MYLLRSPRRLFILAILFSPSVFVLFALYFCSFFLLHSCQGFVPSGEFLFNLDPFIFVRPAPPWSFWYDLLFFPTSRAQASPPLLSSFKGSPLSPLKSSTVTKFALLLDSLAGRIFPVDHIAQDFTFWSSSGGVQLRFSPDSLRTSIPSVCFLPKARFTSLSVAAPEPRPFPVPSRGFFPPPVYQRFGSPLSLKKPPFLRKDLVTLFWFFLSFFPLQFLRSV